MRERTIREAIFVGLEGLSGTVEEWLLAEGAQRKAMRAHVRDFVHEYALRRGVILQDDDIDTELDAIVSDLKQFIRLYENDDVTPPPWR